MIRVLLAEDMHMVRGALIALLKLEQDIEIVAEVDTGDKIIPMVAKHRPDVAVIDIDMPVMDGLTAADEIREKMPEIRILMLTSLARPGTLRRALSLRVDGFLLKDAPPDQLADAIRDVMAGKRVVDSQLALAAWDSGACPLTDRELGVLKLAAKGADAAEIAKSLSLSVGTVRNYLTTIITKLNARNRIDAIRIADDAGWL
ncbi:response regulator transcription factor [Lentzea flava]|uniref:DNA-binding response regulator n=1 Tax=Lentzea flava TaxID=103732 RepID=A0ABQ2V832_9PSEU|nr:response regulator transcription factor [Lentzea flava]MCP2203881.1 two component transcriptional regulator, LuxR family [Lentzea flava]GGU72476.1 DNA-binding response regulator [Lentzea flava]